MGQTGTLTVCVGTPEAHVRLSLGHRNSTQNEVHTEAGPNKFHKILVQQLQLSLSALVMRNNLIKRYYVV